MTPLNLALRFLLELAALTAMGFWGSRQSDSAFRVVLAVGVPALAAAVWGIFAVPNDPSRSGSAPLPVPGVVRLAIELLFFSFATWTVYAIGATTLSALLALVVTLHYVAARDRVRWLIAQ